jgi:hypothetical protein
MTRRLDNPTADDPMTDGSMIRSPDGPILVF